MAAAPNSNTITLEDVRDENVNLVSHALPSLLRHLDFTCLDDLSFRI